MSVDDKYFGLQGICFLVHFVGSGVVKNVLVSRPFIRDAPIQLV